jgi:hypothetical protein
MLYGSNLPYNIPGSTRYRNALEIDPYLRADIGFGALLYDAGKRQHRSHSPFRNFKSIWASLEIFNVVGPGKYYQLSVDKRLQQQYLYAAKPVNAKDGKF